MIILFIEYNEFNENINYTYNLFFYLKIKIQLINNLEIKSYIDENNKDDNIYIFYEIFDEELFNYLNYKYNKNIYYFVDKYYDLDILERKYEKIKYILLSNNYTNIINFKYKKMILNFQFDINKSHEIKNIENFYIIKNLEDNQINNHENVKFVEYQQDTLYKNRIIIINEIISEDNINLLITHNNIIIIKNFMNVELYFFYNIFILYDDIYELNVIIDDINNNKEKYIDKFNKYMIYLKKKLFLNNKIFYQKIENYENVDDDFGFIILRHVNTIESDKLWINNIKNIRKYYRNKIYIIDDNSNYEYISIKEEFKDINIIKSKFKNRGEILPYYYLYLYELFKQCIIIHDSVFVNKYIDFTEYNDDIYYLWHFDHNANNLELEKYMIQLLEQKKEIDNFYDAKKWYGCFGVQTLIKYSFVQKINDEFKLFSLLNYIDNRQKRMNFERIFSVLCTMIDNKLYEKKSIYGDIKKYIKWEYKYDDYINDKNLEKYDLIKTWSGR